MHYNWSTEKYIKEVEHGSDPGLQEYQGAELDFVAGSVERPDTKTFIDVGAGYGRVLPRLAPLAGKFVAVEQDPDLLDELERRVNQYANARLIVGTGDKLSRLLGSNVNNPVLLSLQNTLGPWDGNRAKALAQLKEVARKGKGEIVVSLFCREALTDWGLPMYATVTGLLGRYDSEKSDLLNGYYRTDTGYESYWFSAEERAAMKEVLGGTLRGEIKERNYHIFHLSY